MTTLPTEYDPETCLTAGELRATGAHVPENIPDCAWVPRCSVVVRRPPSVDIDPIDPTIIRVDTTMEFTAPFRWIKVEATFNKEETMKSASGASEQPPQKDRPILEGSSHCVTCGGCGVLFGGEGWVGKELQACDTCRRYSSDLEAAKAAGELVKGVYANNRRAMDVGGSLIVNVSNCQDCPFYSIDVNTCDKTCSVMPPIEQGNKDGRAWIRYPEFEHEVAEEIHQLCPLKKFVMTVSLSGLARS